MIESLMIQILNGILWLLLDPDGKVVFMIGWIVSVILLLIVMYYTERGGSNGPGVL
jgi:inner membrane protein involved in colicin E2 resistance